jgi:hypothetical protein
MTIMQKITQLPPICLQIDGRDRLVDQISKGAFVRAARIKQIIGKGCHVDKLCNKKG